jgi:tRNA threonylcarbamoyladenosine biosynthesis protein TsaE
VIHAATKSAEDTRELAAALAPLVRGGDILLLAGELGAGKTCFTQGLGRALGIEEPITSPTFTLLRPYEGRVRLLHADVYRLDHLQEIVDLGIVEQVDTDAVAVIEWGDRAEPVLPADFLEIAITFAPGYGDDDDDDDRRFALRPVGSSWSNRAGALQRSVERWAVTA